MKSRSNKTLSLSLLSLSLFSSSGSTAPVLGQGTWLTTLFPRDLDGDQSTAEAYYDRVLDITWLADANYAATIGVSTNPWLTWYEADEWVKSLEINGISGWRLPTMLDTGAVGCENDNAYGGTDCGYNPQTTSGSPPYPASTIYSEFATLVYDTLGDQGYYDMSGHFLGGNGFNNTGPFKNFKPTDYWYGLDYAPDPLYETWLFYLPDGGQIFNSKFDAGIAWPVHSGDVGTPIELTTMEQYQVTDLGTLDGIPFARKVNNISQVAGSSGTRAFLWESGVMSDLGDYNGTGAAAVSINDSSWVVGHSNLSGDKRETALLWEGGGAKAIYGRDSWGSYATGINNRNEIVGFAFTNNTSPFKISAFRWRNGNTEMLRNLWDENDQAQGINDSGQIVGQSYIPTKTSYHAFLWDSGIVTDLGTLGGPHSFAHAINNRGQIVGVSYLDPNEKMIHGFLWENGIMKDLGDLKYVTDMGINNLSQVVGSANGRATLWQNEFVLDLNDLIPKNSGWELQVAYDINDRRQIVGTGKLNGEYRAFLLSPVSPAVAAVDNQVSEDVGTAVVDVVLSPASAETVSVHYETLPGTALLDEDFEGSSGDLVFAPGETKKSIQIPIINDAVAEPRETVRIRLSSSAGANIFRSESLLIINDDDQIRCIADNVTVDESVGTANVEVELNHASTEAVTVSYATRKGTALPGRDYRGTSGTLTFNPGETTKMIPIKIINDQVPETTEDFIVKLLSPINVVIADDEARVTINDDDAYRLKVYDLKVPENVGTAKVRATLNYASNQTVTAIYATQKGTALPGRDYRGTSGTLTFSPGETTKIIPIRIINDQVPERTERFTVKLKTPVNATIADGQATVTITDGD